MPVDPSIAAILDQVNAHPVPRVIDTDPEVLREANRRMGAGVALREPIEVGSVENTAVPSPAGQIPVRVYRPEGGGPVPTVVFFHGGGWLTGDLDTHDDVTRRMCRDVHTVVVAVDYRLAPEHPFPAAYDDCLAAAHHVADHIDDYGGRRDRLAVAGDSAGGNLAAAVALTDVPAGTHGTWPGTRLRFRGGYGAFRRPTSRSRPGCGRRVWPSGWPDASSPC
ncbi:alpha/beta hydrolase [Streptomyces sp. NBC_00162]|uniref:alpha/beta hydrolase n=1 Tax=Streptomyces sp. NBC_00162 TaxID=2903629 RepID=UPI00214CDDFC|nr:alpha/beta hydrolase [Streptomyces sp. NBC_00162]UUU38221.1 alpha/beta hydrolase [Streptomyces sp. NBC_00162]